MSRMTALAAVLVVASLSAGCSHEEDSRLQAACARLANYDWFGAYEAMKSHPKASDFEDLSQDLTTSVGDGGVIYVQPGGKLAAQVLGQNVETAWADCRGAYDMPPVKPIAAALTTEIRRSDEAWSHLPRPDCGRNVEVGFVVLEDENGTPRVTGIECGPSIFS